jgi:uncharacterized membrane protein YfcA
MLNNESTFRIRAGLVVVPLVHDFFALIFAGLPWPDGLTGVGGGSLMTLILVFLFRRQTHLAIGTDLLFAAFTKMAARSYFAPG